MYPTDLCPWILYSQLLFLSSKVNDKCLQKFCANYKPMINFLDKCIFSSSFVINNHVFHVFKLAELKGFIAK